MRNITILNSDFAKELELQLAPAIKAGFPSPADDYRHDRLDFNRDLIRHPEATFYGRVDGDSLPMVISSWLTSTRSSPSNTSTLPIRLKDISNCAPPTATSNPSASMKKTTSRCGAW